MLIRRTRTPMSSRTARAPPALTRTSTATGYSDDSAPVVTPYDDLPLPRNGGGGSGKVGVVSGGLAGQDVGGMDSVRIRRPSEADSDGPQGPGGWRSERMLGAESAGGVEGQGQGSYFALPPRQAHVPQATGGGGGGGANVSRRGTTKELIGRFETMERSSPRATASRTSSTFSRRQQEHASPSSSRASPGAGPSPPRQGEGARAKEKDKDKGRSPIRQSFRNLLSVFKKSKPAHRESSPQYEGASARISPSSSVAGTRYKAGGAPACEESRRGLSPPPPPPSKPSLTLQIPPTAPFAQTDPRSCASPISAHAGKQGPLLYLCRTSPQSHGHGHGEQQSESGSSSSSGGGGGGLPPVWMSCLAQLHTTHVLISWQTAQGNPTSRLVPFTACSDVRSLALSELAAEERALLPEGRPELRVFELLFEGRAREKFAAEGVTERAGWENRVRSPAVSESAYTPSPLRITPPEPVTVVRATEAEDTSSFPAPSSRLSQPSAISTDRALPPVPTQALERPVLPRLDLRDLPPLPSRQGSMPSGLSPLPAPPVTPTSAKGSGFLSPTRADSPSRTQSPSIRNLDQRSVVKQRLAQIEMTASARRSASPASPSTRRWEFRDSPRMQRQDSRASDAAASILNSYTRTEMEVASPRSVDSGRLTTLPPSPLGSPPPRNSRLSQEAQSRSSQFLNLPKRDDTIFSAASEYSSTDGPVPAGSVGAASHIRSALEALSIPLPASAVSIAPPVLLTERGLLAENSSGPALNNIQSDVDALRGRSATDSTNIVNIRVKVDEVLTEVRGLRAQGRDEPGALGGKLDEVQTVIKEDLSKLQGLLEGLQSHVGAAGQTGSIANIPDATELHSKLDNLLRLCQARDGEGASSGQIPASQLAEVVSLLKDAEEQRITQMEQQTDSIRYLNELNTWLEAFVKHGTSQIEGVAAGVQQLCKELGPVEDVSSGEEGKPSGNLLSEIRRFLAQHSEREQSAANLSASVNGLVAAVQEDLQRNAEARNVLKLTNEIRGERLRFVEAMRDATAINVQIHVEEFKKELTREVMIMTQEVTRLQRERQGLEQQIADLFAFYAKQKKAGKEPCLLDIRQCIEDLFQVLRPARHALAADTDPAFSAVGRTDNAKSSSPLRSSRSATKVMSALRLVTAAARRAPRNFALGRRGYAEAADKINLSLVLPHQAIFTSADVVQVNLAAATGDMGILANHAPTIEPLRPGVVEVIEAGNQSKKWFVCLTLFFMPPFTPIVSGGFATVHPNNKLTINAVEAAPLEAFSAEAVRANLQEALRVAAGNGPEEDKVEARIEADVYEALQHALAKTRKRRDTICQSPPHPKSFPRQHTVPQQAVMRTPASWHDRSLLQDDPFASQFLIRQLYVTPSEGRRSEDWCKELANEIKKTPELQAAADRWIGYAFAPEGITPASQLLARSKRKNPVDLTEIFVRFYWAWFNDDTGYAALKVVNDARKNRGYAYRLPRIPEDALNGSPTEPNATDLGPSVETAPDALESHAAGGNVEGNNAACTSTEGATTSMYGEASSLRRSPEVEDFGEIDSAENPCVASAREETLADDSAGAVDRTPIPPHQEGHALSLTRQHVEVASSTPPESGPSSDVPVDASNFTQLPNTRRSKKKKQKPTDMPAIPLRKAIPRSATNTQRLSLLAEQEFRYHKNLKRIHDDEVDFNAMLPVVPEEDAPSREEKSHRRKKSKSVDTHAPAMNLAERDVTLPLMGATVSVPQELVAPDSAPSPLSGTAVADAPETFPSDQTISAGRRNKKAKPSAARKKSKTSEPSRPSKRRRGLNEVVDPIKSLNIAMTHQTQSLKSISGVPDAAPVPPSNTATSTETTLGRRTRNQTGSLPAPVSRAPVIVTRQVAKLPQKKSIRKRLADMPPPAATAGALGIPSNLPEADRIVQHAAMAASLILENPTETVDEWTEDKDVQEIPPSSDDEEDIPLSAIMGSERLVRQAPFIPTVLPLLQRPPSAPAATHAPLSSVPSTRAIASKPRAPPSIPIPAPPKPPLPVRPTIWAESRQELCESFDWFRSYQGGVYFNNDMVKGYLLSAFSSSNNGQSTLLEADDQRAEDKSVRALLQTYRMKRPLVLIIDDRYSSFPYDLATKGYTYVVLGFYHIAHAWAEREPSGNGRGSVVRWKFAFEWCEKQPAPWWIVNPNAGAKTPREDGTAPPEDLRYHPSFLNSSFQCDHEPLEGLEPSPPATGASDGVITSRRFCKGWHCKKCGRLSSRYKWEHWECQSCGTTLQISGKTRNPKEFWAQTNSGGFYHHKLADDSGIIVTPLQKARTGNGFCDYHVYILPENRGRIYLITGNPLINRIADEIFAEYQEQARSGELRFRRWPLKSHQCRGTFLTNYFSQNRISYILPAGEPYQYVGGTANTVPFDSAPSAVVKARSLIQDRMASVVQAERERYEFNEVLSAAYMEKQKMAFHSDAERGLGPRVASLSLGSSAHMHFRLLKKYRTDKGSGSHVNALTLFLRHGDVLIMDGAEIQEYYEHTVVPLNFRIAATARYIGAA
ncbi:hypothetical protein ACG7TL_004758 [Trametes sanguinea]